MQVFYSSLWNYTNFNEFPVKFTKTITKTKGLYTHFTLKLKVFVNLTKTKLKEVCKPY